MRNYVCKYVWPIHAVVQWTRACSCCRGWEPTAQRPTLSGRRSCLSDFLLHTWLWRSSDWTAPHWWVVVGGVHSYKPVIRFVGYVVSVCMHVCAHAQSRWVTNIALARSKNNWQIRFWPFVVVAVWTSFLQSSKLNPFPQVDSVCMNKRQEWWQRCLALKRTRGRKARIRQQQQPRYPLHTVRRRLRRDDSARWKVAWRAHLLPL